MTHLDVNADIYGNVLAVNDIGIDIQNNKSKLIENMIEKSHEHGIKVVGDDKNTRCMP